MFFPDLNTFVYFAAVTPTQHILNWKFVIPYSHLAFIQ